MACAAASRLTLRRCRVASSLSQLSTRTFHGSSSLFFSEQEPDFDGVSADVSKLIYHHAHQPQTAVSLQALMRTGRGEYLHKTYKEAIVHKEDDEKGATEQVLMQVCSSYVLCAFIGGSGKSEGTETLYWASGSQKSRSATLVSVSQDLILSLFQRWKLRSGSPLWREPFLFPRALTISLAQYTLRCSSCAPT